MKNVAKAAIATTIGVALLLGGAGTLASWNSSATISGGTVVAGNLLVADDATAGVWKANGTTITLAGYKVVPGDQLTFTKTMNITATGNNLVATLGIAPASIVGSTAAAADGALAGYLTKSAVLTATGTGIAASGGNYTITAGTAGVVQSVSVTVTIGFPKNAAAGFAAEDATKTGSVSLAGMAITLTQN